MPAKWMPPILLVCMLLAVTTGARAFAAVRTAREPLVRRTTIFYELRAPSLTELVAEFRTVAGRGDVPVRYGLTKWDIRLDPSPNRGTRTSCAPDRVTLSVALTTVLPKAVRLAEFSQEDATEWRRFTHALVRHEAQHDSIVIDQATTFLRAVERDADGARAPRSIMQCVTTLLERIEHASNTFDALTQHGRNEGAALIARGSTPPGP